MKLPFITLLLFLILSNLLLAQNISVQSFKHLTNDMDARVNHPKTDQNGDKCAIIKVVTTEQGFSWEGDMFGIVDTKHYTAEYWLYIPHGAKRLTIKHHQLGVLRDYNYPEAIKEAHVYELKLTTADVQTIIVPQNIPMQWLVIDSKPAGATVYIDDDLQSGLTPFTKKFKTAKYNIRLELANHHTYAERIDLTEDVKLERIIDLRPAYGSISIHTEPEEGAIIVLDGQAIHKSSPTVLNQISSGSHNIKLMKELYEVYEMDIIVEDGKTTTINASLAPQFSDISINTKNNAAIYDNGDYLAQGNWKGRLEEGVHQLEAKLENHYSAKETITVTAGKSETLEIFPQPISGSIDINSQPYGAKILIDGKDYGTTPNTVKGLIIGKHELVLVKKEYCDLKMEFEIIENELISKSAKLSNVISVHFSSIPSEAELTLNGQNYGKTPISLDLSVSKYDIVIEKSGYIPFINIIDVSEKKSEYIINLLQSKCNVIINSTPKNGSVLINGNLKGKTPLEIALTPGKHQITVTKKGHSFETKPIYIKKDTLLEFSIKKESKIEKKNVVYKNKPYKKFNKVKISANTPGVMIFINNKYNGKTPLILNLPSSDYVFSAKKHGYKAVTKRLGIENDSDIDVMLIEE